MNNGKRWTFGAQTTAHTARSREVAAAVIDRRDVDPANTVVIVDVTLSIRVLAAHVSRLIVCPPCPGAARALADVWVVLRKMVDHGFAFIDPEPQVHVRRAGEMTSTADCGTTLTGTAEEVLGIIRSCRRGWRRRRRESFRVSDIRQFQKREAQRFWVVVNIQLDDTFVPLGRTGCGTVHLGDRAGGRSALVCEQVDLKRRVVSE